MELEHTSMNDLLFVKIGKTIQHPVRDFSKHFLAGPSAAVFYLSVDAVQTTALAEFHGYGYRARVIHEGSVIFAYMVRCAVLIEGQLTDYLFLDLGTWIGGDDLPEPLVSKPDYTVLQIQACFPDLEGKFYLSALQLASGHRASCTLPQATKLDYLLLFARRFPTIIV